MSFLFRLEEFRTKYYIVKSDNKKVWENCSDLKRQLEDKVNELENVNSKLNRRVKTCRTDRNISLKIYSVYLTLVMFLQNISINITSKIRQNLL